jgi:hypothetical protein
MQRETTSVRLRITSTALTAADIEARLGVKPDESWKIGDRTGAFGAILKEHGYALDAVALYTVDLAAHMLAMRKRVAPVVSKLGELSSQVKVELICTMLCKAPPPLVFERDDLRWLTAVGARIGVELSILVNRAQPAAEKIDLFPASES